MIQRFKKFLVSSLIFCILFVLSFVSPLIPTSAKTLGADIGDTEEGGGGSEFAVEVKIPSLASLGEEVEARALQGGQYSFIMGPARRQYNWIAAGKTVQSILAGSEDKFYYEGTDLRLGNKYGHLVNEEWKSFVIYDGWIDTDDGSPYSLYREPNVDTDGDGMDDDWEIRYFGDLSHNGTADSDGDGFGWCKEIIEDVDYEDECGDMEAGAGICEGLRPCCDDDPHNPKEAGVTYVWNPKTDTRLVIGNDNFTDYEEYVFGLNPLIPDTDGDGTLDEADVAGMDQEILRLKLTEKFLSIGDKIYIGVVALGMIKLHDPSLKDGRYGLVYDFKRTVVSPGPPLRVVLIPEPRVPTPANTGDDYPKVKVKAEVQGEEKREKLYFKWYIGKNVIEEGYNKSEFEFPVTTNPCEKIPIVCDVSDEETGRLGSADLELEVGENITEEKLHASLIGTEAAEEGPVEDPCGPDIDVDGGFVRVGDIIKVHATLDFCKLPGNYLDSNGPEDFVYQWYLDGKEQINQTGAGDKENPELADFGGGTFQDFKFTVTKAPGNEHLVKLKLIRISDGFEYGQLGEKVFTAQTPTAPISTPALGDPGSCDEIGSGGECRVILEPGETQTVDFKTVLENFQPTYAPSFHYIWTFDGEVPRDEETGEVIGVNCGGVINQTEGYCESNEAESTLSFEFSHPGGIEEETIETHSIGLTAENYVYATGGPHETAMDTYTMEVVLKPGGGAVARGPVRTFFAQAGQAVSSYFKNIFNIVLTIGVIGFIVFVVMAAGQIKRKKE